MKKKSIISIFVHSLALGFCLLFLGNTLQSAALASSYEKEFDGGFVTVEVSDNIIFSITVTEGSGFFCNVLQFIEQDDNRYTISTDNQGEGYIQVDWIGFFDGCGTIDLGQPATGIMSNFPSSFTIEDPFRLNYSLGIHGLDYFDITPGSPTTTIPITTTTSSNSTTTSANTTTSLTPPSCLIEQLYGEQSQETELLRQVRDNLLITTPEGQELIRLYYQWSFMLAGALEEDETFREDVQAIIDDILPLIGDMF